MATNFNLPVFTVLIFGGLFCLAWSVGLSLSASKGHWSGRAFVFINGLRLTWESLLLGGLLQGYDRLLPAGVYGLFLPAMYLIGPFLYLYYLRQGRSHTGSLAPGHWVAVIVACSGWLVWFSQGAIAQQRLVENLTSFSPQQRNLEDWLLLAWVLGPKFSILGYSILITFGEQGRNLIANELSQRMRQYASALLGYTWIMILADIVGYLAGIAWLYYSSAISHAIAAIVVYWFSRIHPEAMLEIQAAITRARYQSSKLSGLDVPALVAKLKSQMLDERLYTDEDLRLPQLAEACGISAHQLSELLNEHIGQGFFEFVNRYRIQEACAMLLAEPERTTLSVAMAVGFNSKSAFHRAFGRYVGMTPAEYRENAGKKSSTL